MKSLGTNIGGLRPCVRHEHNFIDLTPNFTIYNLLWAGPPVKSGNQMPSLPLGVGDGANARDEECFQPS